MGSAAPLVLVTGATGQTGSLVAAGLRERGIATREVAPNTEISFDWSDPTGWGALLEGVTAVYLMTPTDPSFDADAVGKFLERVQAAGISRMVFLSGCSAEFGSSWMLSREMPVRCINEGELNWTILRPTVFAQNFGPMEPTLIADGGIRRPLGEGDGAGISFIDVRDIADVAVEILTDTSTAHAGKTYYLDGPEVITYGQALRLIGNEIGQLLEYRNMPTEEWADMWRSQGIAEPMIKWFTWGTAGQRRGEYAHVRDGVREVLGRTPRTFQAWVKEAAADGVWS
ncbi:NAD(P)H-binding protein [Streptomyces sp. NPDC004732]|uniref:NAD(P)H-binding protein n=1 Tax=Streptomyces sp. NPDC004732 TaxID=3154290 RepID=UPI0033AA73F3